MYDSLHQLFGDYDRSVARTTALLTGIGEQLDILGGVTAHFDARAAALDQRRVDIDADRVRLIDEANRSAADIVSAAHRAAHKIIADARAVAGAEERRYVGELMEREQRIRGLDEQITKRQVTLDAVNRAITDLRAEVGAA
jgi:vacuolar-type H+-ATPase subunit H